MASLFHQLKQDHQHFVAALSYLEGVVRNAGPNDPFVYNEILEVIKYLSPGLEGRHWAKEHLMWELLAKEKDLSPSFLHKLEAQHDAVIEEQASLVSMMVVALYGTVTPVDELKKRTHQFITKFRDHIALEERTIFPLLKHEDGSMSNTRSAIERRLI